MYLSILLLTTLTALTTSASLPRRAYNLPDVPAPGPIPYPSMPPAQQSVDPPKYGGSLSASADTMLQCLTAYGSGAFYDSWQGNTCGEKGWYKGSADAGKIGTYECYQTCAYYLDRAIKDGEGYYECNYRTGTSGHCWMGYHDPEAA